MTHPPLALHVPLVSLLLAASAWLGLELLARRCFPAGSLGRALLQRARLSVSATLLLAGLGWWSVGLFDRGGAELAGKGRVVRDVVLTLGAVWTLLRCKGTLLRHCHGHPRWLSQRSPSDRTFLIDLLDKLITALVVLIGSLEVARQVGVSPAVLLTASGIGAAAVGFGARSLVENLLGGLMVYVNRPFTVGDRIDLPERKLSGTVRRIGLYCTELVSAEGQPLFLPNAVFGSFAIGNASRGEHRRLLLQVGLRPEERDRLTAVREALQRALDTDPSVEAALPRRLHIAAIEDSATTLRLECFCRNDADVEHDLRDRLLAQAGRALRSAPDAGDPP